MLISPQININKFIPEPYFSILVIVVLLLFAWVVWGTKDRLIIDGMVGAGAASTFVLAPTVAGGVSDTTLAVRTSLLIKPDGVLFLTMPPEMTGITKAGLTLMPTAFGTIDSVSDPCESEDVGEMIEAVSTSGAAVSKCSATKIKIIMNPTSLASPYNFSIANTIEFTLGGAAIKIPAKSPAALAFSIESSANAKGDATPGVATLPTVQSATAPVTFPSGSAATASTAATDITGCKFNIKLSDDAPKAKSVTANYGFDFTTGGTGTGTTSAPSAAATMTIKSGSKIYFVFSDDFDLPTSTANIDVVLNKNRVLSSEKGEYALTYKTKCGTPSSNFYSALPGFKADGSAKFDSEATLCAKYYALTLKLDVDVSPTTPITLSLVGLTNPPYYSPPAPAEKRDYLLKPFNTSICIMQLITSAGKYLINPTPESYANVGLYFRGNYPIKNTGKTSDKSDKSSDKNDDDDNDNDRNKRSGRLGAHSANVYTVNYFYDGQGAGEYGHIAQPEIFGSKPYSYGGGGGSASDKYLAKHYNDLSAREQKRQQAAAAAASSGQIVPRRGVAPSALNGGVQPYNSEIHF